MGFITEMQGFFNICKSINVIHHIKKLKNKNHMIISTDAENSTPTYAKNCPGSGLRGNLHQHNKGHIWQTHSKHHSQWWNTKNIFSKIRNKTRMSTLALLFNIVLEVLATAIREEKEIKGIQTGKEVVKLRLQMTWYYT